MKTYFLIILSYIIISFAVKSIETQIKQIKKFLDVKSLKREIEIDKKINILTNEINEININKNTTNKTNIISTIIILKNENEKQKISKYDPLYGQAKNINCTEKNCIGPNKCLYGNTFCNCSIEFANFFEEENLINNKTEKIYCSYERKKQLTAFILTMFFNFGVAQFYLGIQDIGFIKLGISMISVLLLPFAICYKRRVLLSMLIGLFVCFVISIWGLIDMILFGINYYNDGNDVPLNPW